MWLLSPLAPNIGQWVAVWEYLTLYVCVPPQVRSHLLLPLPATLPPSRHSSLLHNTFSRRTVFITAIRDIANKARDFGPGYLGHNLHLTKTICIGVCLNTTTIHRQFGPTTTRNHYSNLIHVYKCL